MTGFYVSNCAALAIVEDSYRLIVSDGNYHNITPYAKVARWEKDQYTETEIMVENEYRPLNQLYKK